MYWTKYIHQLGQQDLKLLKRERCEESDDAFIGT